MKKVTIAALIEASEKNGFAWAHQGIFGEDGIYSCVVGQGIRNLDGTTFPTDIYIDSKRTVLAIDEDLKAAFKNIYNYNDDTALSYNDAFEYMKRTLAPYRRRKVPISYDD